MQVLAFVWVPTLLDALVPFSFLACELFLAHFVYQDLRNWLLTLGLTCVVGAAAHIVTNMQARTLAEENRDVARVLEPHRRYRAVFVAVIVVFFLCLSALYDVLHLGQVRLVIALVALIVVGGVCREYRTVLEPGACLCTGRARGSAEVYTTFNFRFLGEQWMPTVVPSLLRVLVVH